MTFINMLKDESGASAAEYALILAIVGTGIALAALFLGGEINKAMTQAGETICTPKAGVNNCGDGTKTTT
jgi:pilus assembly protein Flp/PilA